MPQTGRFLALDVGDVWVGSAVSDPLGIVARPYQTVRLVDVVDFIIKTITTEDISAIVVGLPTTMGGKESEQTIKTRGYVEELREAIAKKLGKTLEWVWWDERTSSQQAQRAMRNIKGTTMQKRTDKKQQEHSVAAAIVLQGYLDRRAFINTLDQS